MPLGDDERPIEQFETRLIRTEVLGTEVLTRRQVLKLIILGIIVMITLYVLKEIMVIGFT